MSYILPVPHSLSLLFLHVDELDETASVRLIIVANLTDVTFGCENVNLNINVERGFYPAFVWFRNSSLG